MLVHSITKASLIDGLTPTRTADTAPLLPLHLGLMNPVMLPLTRERVGCVGGWMPKGHLGGGLCDKKGHTSYFFLCCS